MEVTDKDEQSSGREVAGRYRLDTVLGRGGMGVVWLATDDLIGRRVAIKELRAPPGAVGGDKTSFVERSLREARNAGRLNHPGVVGVHDVIAPEDDDTVFIVMEYVDAPTLAEILEQQGPLPEHRVAAMGLGILDALMAAHTMGIVHRDIKPGNVLVRDGDRIKLTDFGIALAAEDTRLTQGGVMGTHAYLAPECFDTGEAGPASDLWSLGATLYHAVAGRAPFDRDTTTATMRAILFEDVQAPPCDPRLAEVITGLLTRPVEERLTSDVARHRLEPVAAEPVVPPPPADAPPDASAGQAAWESQATGFHRTPAPAAPTPTPSPTGPGWGTTQPPAGPPAGSTAQPVGAQGWQTNQPAAGAPSPYSTGQPTHHPATPSPYVTAQPATPHVPPTSGPAYGAAQSSSGSNPNTPWIVGGGIAAAAVLLIILIVAVAGGGDDGGGGGGGGSGPEAAVERLLQAGQDQDLEAAQDTLCQEDLSGGFGDSLASVQIVSYTIGSVEENEDGVTIVNAAIRTTEDDQEVDGEVPVIQEGGSWKVCFSEMLGDIDVGDPVVPGSLRRPGSAPSGEISG